MLTDEDDTRIYDAICRHGGLTTRDLSDGLRIPFDDVRREVERLASPILDRDSRKMNGTSSPPLIVFRDGGWHQNHGTTHARTAAAPGGAIKLFCRGPEGGRVTKRSLGKAVRR